LKQAFKDLSPSEAVYSLLQNSPERAFSMDEVITELYTELTEAEQKKTRKNIGLVLGRGFHQGKFEKVQEEPKLYKFKI